MHPRRTLVTALVLLCASAVGGQSVSENAAKLLADGQWEPAAAAYRQILAAEPKNADAWFSLGLAERNRKRYPEAAAAFQNALDNGYDKSRGYAALGFAKALGGDRDAAFAALSTSVAEGLPPQVLDTHPAMASLQGDPRLAALKAQAEARAHPCANDARYRAFDFWVGDWDVFSGTQQIGHNRIEKMLDGCLLMESWTDGYGNSGKSMNYYDPASGRWRQNWVDENGGVVTYEGEIREGGMRYSGENLRADGRRSLARVRLTPQSDGTVRHVIETSTDGGKTWSNSFDAVYRPARPQGAAGSP